MGEENSFQLLQDIFLEYNILFFDTCGLTKFLPKGSRGSSTTCEFEFILLLARHLGKGAECYIFPEVIDQYLSKKRFRKKPPSPLEKRAFDARKDLVYIFNQQNKVFKLNGNKNLEQKYLIKTICEKHNDTKTDGVDRDILFSVFDLCTKKGPVALVSNDFGVFNAWKNLLKFWPKSYKDFGLYKRRGINFFEGWWYDKNYDIAF